MPQIKNVGSVRIRLADGFEVRAKSVTMEMSEPSIMVNRNGRCIRRTINDLPLLIIELDDQELFRMAEFFGILKNFVGKPKLIPAKPGVKRLINLT